MAMYHPSSGKVSGHSALIRSQTCGIVCFPLKKYRSRIASEYIVRDELRIHFLKWHSSLEIQVLIVPLDDKLDLQVMQVRPNSDVPEARRAERSTCTFANGIQNTKA
jgi:hypothetical protein